MTDREGTAHPGRTRSRLALGHEVEGRRVLCASPRLGTHPERAVGAAVRLRHEDQGSVGLLDHAGLLRMAFWHHRPVRLVDRINHRLDVAAQRSAPVFDEETRQWRFPEEEEDVPTGYWVAEGCSWFGPVGWAGALLIAVVTWLRHRRRRG